MKKVKIALLVISLFFVVVLGTLVIGNNFNLTIKAGEEVQYVALGDFALGFIPVVRDFKFIAYTVAGGLLIVFSILAGMTVLGNSAPKKAKKKVSKKASKKVVEIKAPAQAQAAQQPAKIKVKF
jgi:hypothetical protein